MRCRHGYTVDEGLLLDRLTWRRKKGLNQGAIEILDIAPKASQMHNPKKWWTERHIIVRRLIEQGRYRLAYDVASGHRQEKGFPHSQGEWVFGFYRFAAGG